eukprot:Lankesteria_metandrocarpae@DN3962_c1_g1_i1.p1
MSSRRRGCGVAVMGGQFGDEGKGKIVDILASKANICCRCNGGSNAGHTIVLNGKKHALHLVPCGVFVPKTINLIGGGVVAHLPTLVNELNGLKQSIPDIFKRVFICKRAHIVLNVHREIDACREAQGSTTGKAIGTTKRGIGPCYASKCHRNGLRFSDLVQLDKEDHWNDFKTKYSSLHAEAVQQFPSISIDIEAEMNEIREFAAILQNNIVDGVLMLAQSRTRGDNILVEGANAVMLDGTYGTYPFVTSSSTIIGAVNCGLGMPLNSVDYIVGVVKAYTTRVGNGPFPTELFCDVSAHMQKVGAEFGTTTGRVRRCGWLDIPMLQYAAAISGYTCIMLSKLDVLSNLKELKLCTAYKSKTTGQSMEVGAYLTSKYEFLDYEPVYETMPGWSEPLDTAREWTDLPTAAQNYVLRIEELLEIPITWIGTGPDREQVVSRRVDDAARNWFV